MPSVRPARPLSSRATVHLPVRINATPVPTWPVDHDPRSIVAALLVALGLVGAGWFAAQGMARLKTADRYVTVKGSAEKIVDADLVVWPLPHSVGGNDLGRRAAPARRQHRARSARSSRRPASSRRKSWCRRRAWRIAGPGRPATTDRRSAIRYSTTVILRTSDVANALAALRRSGELVAAA